MTDEKKEPYNPLQAYLRARARETRRVEKLMGQRMFASLPKRPEK